jgi:hypothetical protein
MTDSAKALHRYEETGRTLEGALGFYIRNAMVDQVKISPFYWAPFGQSDPRKRPLIEKLLDSFGIAHLIHRPPIQCHYNMLVMKEALAIELQEGRLRAVGYVVPRDTDDPPVLIPADVWKGTVNWVCDEVEGTGLRFVGVRIIDEDELAEVEGVETADAAGIARGIVTANAGTKTRGTRKPSDIRREAARKACMELLAESRIDGGMTQKQRVHLILKKLADASETRALAERMKSMDERTIDGYIADILDNHLK